MWGDGEDNRIAARWGVEIVKVLIQKTVEGLLGEERNWWGVDVWGKISRCQEKEGEEKGMVWDGCGGVNSSCWERENNKRLDGKGEFGEWGGNERSGERYDR